MGKQQDKDRQPTLQIRRRDLPVEIRTAPEAEQGQWSFEAIAAAAGGIDDWHSIMHPGCWDNELDYFRKFGIVRDEHCRTTGKIVGADSTERGFKLIARGKISETTGGLDQLKLLRDSVYKYASYGFLSFERSWLDGPEAVQAYWDEIGYTPTATDLTRSGCGAVVVHKKVRPVEVSTTWLAANEATQITEVRSALTRGRTLADQTREALDALSELAARIGTAAETRASAGRRLGRETVQLFDQAVTQAIEIRKRLGEAPAPAPPPASDPAENLDIAALYLTLVAAELDEPE